MIAAVDTNVLLDILIPDEEHAVKSKGLIDKYSASGQLVISELVFAELASQFSAEKELREFLTDTSIKLLHTNEKALSLAGERWKIYSKNRKDKLQCPSCGKRASLRCPECGGTISFRQRIISDFMIGAHALVQAEFLVTRDRGFYKTYFKELVIG